MDELLIKVLEQGSVFTLLCLVLWFMGKTIIPRWFREMESLEHTIHEHAKFDAQVHQAMMLIMTEFSSRLQWHEAKVIPQLNGEPKEQLSAVAESFERAQKGTEALRQDIKEIFQLMEQNRTRSSATR